MENALSAASGVYNDGLAFSTRPPYYGDFCKYRKIEIGISSILN